MAGTYQESLLNECHQSVCTLGLLTHSVLIKIAWGLLSLVKNCHGEDDIKKISIRRCLKKNQNFPLKIVYNMGVISNIHGY